MRFSRLAAGLGLLFLSGLFITPVCAEDADLKITITNGKETRGDFHVDVRSAGQHNGDVIVGGTSGDDLKIAPGTYDVEVSYSYGNASKIIWFDGMKLSGRTVKTVDMAFPVASLRVVITNGGTDVKDNGTFEVRPNGNHSADVIAYERSGGTVYVAAGTYSVDIRFGDGSANKTIWLDGLVLSGTVNRTAEVAAALADVTWRIVNHGQDLASDAKFQIRPAGHHEADVIASGSSGQAVRLSAGTYDIDFQYGNGMINKMIWLDHQMLSGKIDRTTDLALNIAHPTVNATLNGADVGNKARIGITPAGQEAEVGDMHSGETAVIEAGRYDLTATMPGAEGLLKAATIAGQTHLTVTMKTLQTAELKPGAPPPRQCTIEVYGVNFDFDKSSLRPDSEPVLQAVLKLFSGSPAFGAEVGGHTDNIGIPYYNMKLSEARAAAVKAWLVAHGVSGDRVTSRGYGDTHPLVANDTDANRFKNRRVELRRTNCH